MGRVVSELYTTLLLFATFATTHSASRKKQSRRTRAGSVRLARHAGNRQAKMAVVVITAKANVQASFSCTMPEMAADTRFQLAVSFSSCFRPGGVRE